MTPRQRPVEINMSGIPVNGIGGLGLVAVTVLMTIVMPEAWGLVLLGAAGGVVLAVALVLLRRNRVPSGPSSSDPTILFRAEPVKRDTPARDDSEHFVLGHGPSGSLSV